MDATTFVNMLSDKRVLQLRKLGYKYPQADLQEFVRLLEAGFYRPLGLKDFQGKELVYLENTVKSCVPATRILLHPGTEDGAYGIQAMGEEIAASFTIENIDFTRESVRRIMAGHAPQDAGEERILGMKRGLEFICDRANTITEENIHRLYLLAIDPYLAPEDRLLPGNRYRHDSVFVVGNKVEHTGLNWRQLPDYMAGLTDFIQQQDGMDDLLKAAVVHFYLAYLHPYFDGNGRMARLLHLWFLVQSGYPSAMYVPLSGYVEKTRAEYYAAFSLAEENAKISGRMDLTPFLVYFMGRVYPKLAEERPASDPGEAYEALLSQGDVTEKEKALWMFVLSAYGKGKFSTKMLERDFGNAAYATIHNFVHKFEEKGLLKSVKYSNRVRYSVK